MAPSAETQPQPSTVAGAEAGAETVVAESGHDFPPPADQLAGQTGDVVQPGQADAAGADLPPLLRRLGPLHNDLYPAAVSVAPALDEWRAELASRWSRPVLVTGSGPTLFAYFLDRAEAGNAIADIPPGARAAAAALPIPFGWALGIGEDEYLPSAPTDERTAEMIKTSIGDVMPEEPFETMDIKGRDLVSGVPKTLTINSGEIRAAIVEQVDAIVEAVKIALELTPPELSADIVDQGIVLTGGGALLRNLDQRLNKETGLPIIIAEDPLSSVVLGSGSALDNIDILKEVMINW